MRKTGYSSEVTSPQSSAHFKGVDYSSPRLVSTVNTTGGFKYGKSVSVGVPVS